MPALSEPVGGFVYRVSGQKAANDFTAEEAEKQRNWEEKMSNSAYQRAVKDMQKAGLNPAAMYGGSAQMASTPGGASASSGAGQFGSVIGGIASVINSAGNMARFMNDKNELYNKAKIYNSAEKLMAQAYKLSKFK